MKKGRPKKTLKESRILEVKVMMNEDEYAQIYEKSLLVKKKISTYMREHCLDHHVVTFEKDVSKFFFEIGKVGVNLNQLVKKINSFKDENLQSADKFLGSAKTTEIDEALEFLKQSRKLWITMSKTV